MTRFTAKAVERHIRKNHPGCPDFAVTYIVERISERDWQGRSLGAAVGTTMQGILRHVMTDYDSLLLAGIDRIEARKRVQPRINALLAVWSKERKRSPIPSDEKTSLE
ncbi:DUF2293 domain-containing protein [Devosia sp. FKR38]|uniref:DUF2293 domain-containing protein n=1 Tax=Devosia sp. FKR38 TaxID=2562312 RepID=UPI0010C0DD82|nr:DUF2293 domain-containing protein [Devosia sp. FKR38]